MEIIGAFEAKTHFSQLPERVQAGERIVITKHGLPVAKLTPVGDADPTRIANAVRKMKDFPSEA